jgi:6-pyruvoyltetrahydropterin/6-carboxytetrahydropterin synthase
MSYRITRYHDFSAGHRVYGHESKCAMLHGHNYRILFTCGPAGEWNDRSTNDLDLVGRVVDFSVVKRTLCDWLEENWDHKLLLWDQDPIVKTLNRGGAASAIENEVAESVVVVPFNPTAENIARFLVEELGPKRLVPYGVVLVSCTVQETRKCSATYTLPGRDV